MSVRFGMVKKSVRSQRDGAGVVSNLLAAEMALRRREQSRSRPPGKLKPALPGPSARPPLDHADGIEAESRGGEMLIERGFLTVE